MRRLAAVALCFGCVASACTNGNTTSETTLTTATTIAAATTTPTTTAATESTEPPPTTTPDATAAAPTTTSEADTLAAVEQAYFDARAAFQSAIQDPTNDELRSEIDRLFTGANLEQAVETLDSMAANGVEARPHPTEPAQAIVLAEPVISPEDPSIADIVVCEQNSEQFFDIDESTVNDVLIRDEIIVGRTRVRFAAIDGQWKSSSGEVLARLGSFEQCVP